MRSRFRRICWISLLGLALGLSIGASPAAAAEASASTLRAVSWNIQWFPGQHPDASEDEQEWHREEVREYLPGLKPDILLLQEIRDKEAAEFLVDSVPGLDLHVVTTLVRPQPEFSQQMVVASRYPARAGYAEYFTDIYYDEPGVEPYRGFAFAALETPLGGTLLVYSVHLKSNRGNAETNVRMREASARQILEHIEAMEARFEEYGPIVVVVGGDFNVLLERDDMAHERTIDLFLEQGFHWTWEGVPFENRITWPGRWERGRACFDHFVTRGLPELTAEVLHKPPYRLSDHRPVLLEIPVDREE